MLHLCIDAPVLAGAVERLEGIASQVERQIEKSPSAGTGANQE
jgi:hypothetical protein